MKDLLLGHRGFVGSNLAHHYPNAVGVGRKEIQDVRSESFNNVFCAAPQAKKWWANQNPELDKAEVEQLLESCRNLRVGGFFYLFGTVDVYDPPMDVDESVRPSLSSHPYGANRAWLEQELQEAFGARLRIIRLPALVGHGLKKNIIFDLLNTNNIDQINANSSFQWFNLAHLPEIIQFCTDSPSVDCLNVVSEPLATISIVERWFAEHRNQLNWNAAAIRYDVRTVHSPNDNNYLYSALEVMENHLSPFIETSRKN
jgi:nucleoside-diphosphate-sugar epimerase